ncbi:MAG: hypothetical protein C3F02_03185 [Parcubacteria group bacterium]|nr:MAG: hypothetical protein C3F02_03185 [Parcubacteria group bacterium]
MSTPLYIKPKKPRLQKSVSPDNAISRWTLSYRLQGLTLGLAAAMIYHYLYLSAWSYQLLIGAAILGYFLGWPVGRFFIPKSKVVYLRECGL